MGVFSSVVSAQICFKYASNCVKISGKESFITNMNAF